MSRRPNERQFAVQLNGDRIGVLHVREDVTWFVLDVEYIEDPKRAVLGLRFEQDLKARHRANMRLPPWFSNLLPEGDLRQWIAEQRGVSVAREMELLAEVGSDLPGAVTVVATQEAPAVPERPEVVARTPQKVSDAWRFSLAGVQLKFSMLSTGHRFTAPATGEHGDWIVKLPDAKFPHVPRNEFAMMELARLSGMEVPETRLIHRDMLDGIPAHLWPNRETEAYAVRRFDRNEHGKRIHIEDFAQVRGFYPEDKYRGSFDTIAANVYRGHDRASIIEFVRRLAFNVLIRNADAHLKNWSLIYRDPRVPTLAPAYDLVATGAYPRVDQDLGLTLCGSRRFEDVTVGTFGALQQKLRAPDDFEPVVEETIANTLAAWKQVASLLDGTGLRSSLETSIVASAGSMRRRR